MSVIFFSSSSIGKSESMQLSGGIRQSDSQFRPNLYPTAPRDTASHRIKYDDTLDLSQGKDLSGNTPLNISDSEWLGCSYCIRPGYSSQLLVDDYGDIIVLPNDDEYYRSIILAASLVYEETASDSSTPFCNKQERSQTCSSVCSLLSGASSRSSSSFVDRHTDTGPASPVCCTPALGSSSGTLDPTRREEGLPAQLSSAMGPDALPSGGAVSSSGCRLDEASWGFRRASPTLFEGPGAKGGKPCRDRRKGVVPLGHGTSYPSLSGPTSPRDDLSPMTTSRSSRLASSEPVCIVEWGEEQPQASLPFSCGESPVILRNVAGRTCCNMRTSGDDCSPAVATVAGFSTPLWATSRCPSTAARSSSYKHSTSSPTLNHAARQLSSKNPSPHGDFSPCGRGSSKASIDGLMTTRQTSAGMGAGRILESHEELGTLDIIFNHEDCCQHEGRRSPDAHRTLAAGCVRAEGDGRSCEVQDCCNCNPGASPVFARRLVKDGPDLMSTSLGHLPGGARTFLGTDVNEIIIPGARVPGEDESWSLPSELASEGPRYHGASYPHGRCFSANGVHAVTAAAVVDGGARRRTFPTPQIRGSSHRSTRASMANSLVHSLVVSVDEIDAMGVGQAGGGHSLRSTGCGDLAARRRREPLSGLSGSLSSLPLQSSSQAGIPSSVMGRRAWSFASAASPRGGPSLLGLFRKDEEKTSSVEEEDWAILHKKAVGRFDEDDTSTCTCRHANESSGRRDDSPSPVASGSSSSFWNGASWRWRSGGVSLSSAVKLFKRERENGGPVAGFRPGSKSESGIPDSSGLAACSGGVAVDR